MRKMQTRRSRPVKSYDDLLRENSVLREKVSNQATEIHSLKLRLAAADARADKAEARCAALEGLVADLAAKVAELTRRLALDSGNSSKPPSSDGLGKKPARIPSRAKSGRKPGGQTGHEGSTLAPAPDPDEVMDHLPSSCACGAALSAADSTGAFDARQVVDIPRPSPALVCEHRAHSLRCRACGKTTKAEFPAGVSAPAAYGPELMAVAAWLSAWNLVPRARLAMLFAELFGARASASTLASLVSRKAADLREAASAIAETAALAPVKHMDETGVRVAGKLAWLHTVSTVALTSYFAKDRRGDIPSVAGGTIVHDFFGPYAGVEGVRHGMCGAHLVRELRCAEEIDKEPWAGELARAMAQAAKAKAEGTLDADAAEAEYDRLVAEGISFHESLPPFDRRPGSKARRVGHNLALRLRDHRESVLRHLRDPDVPFSNNLAEQALRMPKARQKVSGCFRTMGGAESFADLRTVMETARKQGWGTLAVLRMEKGELLDKIKAAA